MWSRKQARLVVREPPFWLFYHTKIINNTINWIEMFNSQEPHWCSLSCLRLALDKVEPLLCPKYVLWSWPYVPGQEFRGKITQPQTLKILRIYAREYGHCQCLKRSIRGNNRSLTLYRSQWIDVVPLVIFFPDNMRPTQPVGRIWMRLLLIYPIGPGILLDGYSMVREELVFRYILIDETFPIMTTNFNENV